jgi:hypothetical protein
MGAERCLFFFLSGIKTEGSRIRIPALAFQRHAGYSPNMSLVTLEVEIDHGRIIPLGSEPLPEKGSGLLTLLPDSGTTPRRGSVSDFLGEWAGAFSLSESVGDDPRLAYLIKKHAK